jgi:hypothetical protein
MRSENSEYTIKSLFRQTIDLKKYENDSRINHELDNFIVQPIKIVGLAGIILGLVILIDFWVKEISCLYQVW